MENTSNERYHQVLPRGSVSRVAHFALDHLRHEGLSHHGTHPLDSALDPVMTLNDQLVLFGGHYTTDPLHEALMRENIAGAIGEY